MELDEHLRLSHAAIKAFPKREATLKREVLNVLGTGFTISLSVKISVLYRNLEIFGTFGPLYKCLTNFDWIWINFDRIHKKLRKFENFGRDNGLPVGSKISNRHCNHWLGILFFFVSVSTRSEPSVSATTETTNPHEGWCSTYRFVRRCVVGPGPWRVNFDLPFFFFWQLTKEDTNLI